MNNKYDDNFFDELDKTTDLLKSFRPHMETDEVSSELSLDEIYSKIDSENDELHSEKQQFESQNVEQIEQIEEDDVLSTYSKQNVKSSDVKSDIEEIEQLEDIEQEEIEQKNDSINDLIDQISSNKSKQDLQEIDSKQHKKQKLSKIESKKQKKQDKQEKKSSKNEKSKFSPVELLFCSFSFLFIVGCCCVYGSRFLKYYKIYNPKSSNGQSLLLLPKAIGKKSPVVYEGSGLYMNGGDYVYKGKEANNYLRYSNFTWRIIKTNTDGTVDLVLDDYINTLPWSTEKSSFVNSDINKYINDYFGKYLNKDLLVKTQICTDEVNELKKFTCAKKNEDYYVRLLSVNEFLNSKADGTYISNEKDALWLSTKSSDKVWQVNGLSLSLADSNRSLGVKPVIKLKSTVALIRGEGTKENPFIVDEPEKKLFVGSYVQLGNHVYALYDMDKDTISLAFNNVLPKKYYFDVKQSVYNPALKTSLAYLLNTKFYNILPYKDLLIEKEWNIGNYQKSYKDVEKTKVKAKVGMLNTTDLKINNTLQDYYLINNIYGKVGLYGGETIGSNPTVRQNVRPTICIKKRDIKEGDGSLDKPFKLGV